MNNLFWVFWIIFIALVSGSGYILYGLLSRQYLEPKDRKSAAGGSASGGKDSLAQSSAQELVNKEQKILKQAGEINNLSNQLEGLKTDFAKLENDIQAEKKKEQDLREELARREQWVSKSEGLLKKTKDAGFDFEKKFSGKEKEL